jgi:hypothetical protein
MAGHIGQDNNPQNLLDNDLTLRCPHCGVIAGMTVVSLPRYELVHRFKVNEVGLTYRCDSCNRPVVLLYSINLENPIRLPDKFIQVQNALETFEHKYLPAEVDEDLKEALVCFAQNCWNAFAAMCRRCIQSISTDLGAQGTSKVQKQLQDLKEMGAADEETFEQLRQIMLSGHDGAHPHLPKLSQERAAVLMQLMKDILYQLYVRPGKIREAAALRAQQQK